ncbi:MAG: DUF1080 domain-containing protein [Verrucomicrobia bacterium]|nr:DUF1080 domain-containing protein [Verrucomicrobiota bacterium]
MKRRWTVILIVTAVTIACRTSAEESTPLQWVDLFNGTNLTHWIDVNTSADTWTAENGILKCTGRPIGVMRSEKQYENFILEIEWRHMKKKGNSGVFLWSDADPKGGRLPLGMEVQMLELDWVNDKDGKQKAHIGYISGELFGAGGLKATPDNPRGSRSMSKELRCKGVGEWNKYVVVAVDGVVKLSINGKFVNGIRLSSKKKGYLCLESEGSPIEFRNIRIMELPGGILEESETTEELK